MVDMKDLDNLVTKGQELKRLLTESPEIIEYMRLAQQGGGDVLLPERMDHLISAKKAAFILGVGKSTVYRLESEGHLTAFYTPNSRTKKYWMSDVMRVATPAKG